MRRSKLNLAALVCDDERGQRSVLCVLICTEGKREQGERLLLQQASAHTWHGVVLGVL